MRFFFPNALSDRTATLAEVSGTAPHGSDVEALPRKTFGHDLAWDAWQAVRNRVFRRDPPESHDDVFWRYDGPPKTKDEISSLSAQLALLLVFTANHTRAAWYPARRGFQAIIATGSVELDGSIGNVDFLDVKLRTRVPDDAPSIFVAPFNQRADFARMDETDRLRFAPMVFRRDLVLPRAGSGGTPLIWLERSQLVPFLAWCVSGPPRRWGTVIATTAGLIVATVAALATWHTVTKPTVACPGMKYAEDRDGFLYVFPNQCRAEYLKLQRKYEEQAVELAYVTQKATNAFVDDLEYLHVVARTNLGANIASSAVLDDVVHQMQLRVRNLRHAIDSRHVPVLVAFSERAFSDEMEAARDVRQKKLVIAKYQYVLRSARADGSRVNVVMFSPADVRFNGLSLAFIRSPQVEVVANAHQQNTSPQGANNHIISSQVSEVGWVKERIMSLRGSKTPADNERALTALAAQLDAAAAQLGAGDGTGSADAATKARTP